MKKITFFFLVALAFIRRLIKSYKLDIAVSLYRSPRLFFNRLYIRIKLNQKAIIAGLLLTVSAAILIRFSDVFKNNPSISEGVVGIYHSSSLPLYVSNLLSLPLFSVDDSGKPVPVIASEWRRDDASKIYTIKLKDNLVWDDGTKLTSTDIRFKLQDVEVSYPDAQTIEFKLADSFVPFLNLLTSPVFKNDTLVGLGSYRVAHAEYNKNLITKMILAAKKEGLPEVVIRFYPDEKIARTAFELGEVQSLMGLQDPGFLREEPSVQVKYVPNFGKIVAIFYNTKDSVLSDKNIRKALSFATPKIENEESAKTSIPQSSWAYNDSLKEYINDSALAKTYLDKVNYGKDSTIVLTTTNSFAQLGEKIIESWKQAGFKAVLRIESGNPQNFQALLVSEPIPQDPDQYALWHSTQVATNLAKYSSPRIDMYLEEGRKMVDLEKRKQYYLDFQKVLLDESPATFLYYPKTSVVYRKKAISNLEKVLSFQVPDVKTK